MNSRVTEKGLESFTFNSWQSCYKDVGRSFSPNHKGARKRRCFIENSPSWSGVYNSPPRLTIGFRTACKILRGAALTVAI